MSVENCPDDYDANIAWDEIDKFEPTETVWNGKIVSRICDVVLLQETKERINNIFQVQKLHFKASRKEPQIIFSDAKQSIVLLLKLNLLQQKKHKRGCFILLFSLNPRLIAQFLPSLFIQLTARKLGPLGPRGSAAP